MPTDAQLLNFDGSLIHKYDRKKAEATLQGEHGNIYRAQLVSAFWLAQWHASQMKDTISQHSDEWLKGFDYAMREIIAHLRKGDLVPGGWAYNEQARHLGEISQP